MVEKYKYNFDVSTGILYKYYYGPITLDDIFSSWDKAIADNLIPKDVKGFILDYRNANFDIDLFKYPEIAHYYKHHLNIFGNKKIAIITETFDDIAIPSLVKTKDDGYESQPFRKIDSAIKWLLNGQ